MNLCIHRKYNQVISKRKFFRENTLNLRAEILLYLNTKNLTKDDVKEIGEKINKKLINEPEEIMKNLLQSKSKFDKGDVEKKEKAEKWYNEKIKEAKKDNSKIIKIKNDKDMEMATAFAPRSRSIGHGIDFDNFRLILLVPDIEGNPITEDYIKELAKLIKIDFNANTEEILKNVSDLDEGLFKKMFGF